MSARYWSPRLILRHGTTESDVNAFADVMNFRKISEARSDYGVVRRVTWQLALDVEVKYGEEIISGCSFLQVFGESQKDVDNASGALAEHFKPWSWNQVLEAVETAQEIEYKAGALVRAGIAAPLSFDRRFYDCFSSAIKDGNKRIREAGVWACSYSYWPEFKPLLEGVKSNDPVEQLRTDAGVILDVAYRESGL